jgi:hypothetical protein
MFPTLGKHDEIAIGINYIVNPGFIIRGSYHHITGNMFAAPKDTINALKAALIGVPIDDKTSHFIFGAHFAF